MAFGAKRIFPIDTKPGTGVGVAIPFNAPGVFRTTYTTQNAIKTNLIDFFLTEPGERYLNPTFGGGLRSFIFEQISNDVFLIGSANIIQIFFNKIGVQLNLLLNKI